ncbi:hypothetical protein BBC27_00485 [Acidithiobacillus ferrivorans]|uniref:Uncharacterized protein n=1 Tax=Acidithiobacillus ferrivorans TaxID=160808 RepID=A0A1B9C0W1_9PROT|nr:hypothetical protein [Acidithiobacillus ferrivorans]OCB03616.1 hypothetical protein BBC27_00485 [Acidithiobacillus ferrivorans]
MIIFGYDITLSDATFFLALVTAVSVIFTAIVAWYTRKLADHNKELVDQNSKLVIKNDELMRQNERHHMDDARPIVIIEHDDNIERYDARSIVSSIKESGANLGNNYATFSLNGQLRNIGVGIALDVTLMIRFEKSSRKEIIAEFPPLEAASGSRQLGAIEFHTTTLDSDFLGPNNQFKYNEYQSAPGQLWEIYISYKDIYGRLFYTKHPKNPQERWTTLGEPECGIPPGKSKEESSRELELCKTNSQSGSEWPGLHD